MVNLVLKALNIIQGTQKKSSFQEGLNVRNATIPYYLKSVKSLNSLPILKILLPKITPLLAYVLAISILVACGGGSSVLSNFSSDENSGTTPTGVKYKIYNHNTQARKIQNGDLLTFHLIVQNHQDSVLRSTYREGKEGIKELPFEEPYFIAKEYFKEIFSTVAEGDSLSFWISVDSLANKSGYLKSNKTPLGTQIKHTVKILKIRNKNEIKKDLEENLKAQKELDKQLIDKYLDSFVKKAQNLKILKTDSGIQYYLTREGNGQQATKGDTVSVNYVGKLLDGTVHSHSEAPTEFVIGQTIPEGLDESLSLLKEGTKAVMLLPSSLGFGEEGMGNLVPPNAVLIFEVELVKIK
jgi:FKBP-type peptidyl-prolyl cis-trans isomerase